MLDGAGGAESTEDEGDDGDDYRDDVQRGEAANAALRFLEVRVRGGRGASELGELVSLGVIHAGRHGEVEVVVEERNT